MLSKGRLSFTVAIIAVHFVQAVSFVFGAKKDMHSDAAESIGLFAKAGLFFNKLKRTSAHDSEVDYTTKIGGVLPAQLRSSDVKQSRKQWLPTGKTAQVAPKSARTVSHSVSDISEGQNDAYENSLEHSYIQDSAQSELFGAGKSDLNNLNDLLRRNKATNDENKETIADKATMSFKIEITPRAAEITVSIGPTHPLVETRIPVGTNDSQAVDNNTILNPGPVDKECKDTVPTEVVSRSHNMGEALPGTSGENAGPNLDTEMLAIIDPTNKDIAPPVPFLLFDNNNSDIWSNIYTASNATLSPATSTMTINTSTATTIASTAMDLSYIALFCFILGVLCTYLLNKLIHSVITWYKGRIPRYIARLERQSIGLLSEHRYAEVKALLTQHLPCIEAYKGARHTDVAAFRHFLGKALLALGEHLAACEQLNTVVGIYESYGEDLYMAHALEDLALAQQEHSLYNNENADKKGNNKTIQSTVALTTMQRALRIFTEEALALQALTAQPLNTTTSEKEDENVLKELEEMFLQDYGSSPVGTPCCDSSVYTNSYSSSHNSNDTSIEYSMCTDTTIDAADSHYSSDDVFAINWKNEGLSPIDESSRNDTTSSSNSSNSCFYDTLFTHSLDSQDPQSPIYCAYSPVAANKDNKPSNKHNIHEEYATKVGASSPSPVKRKNVLFESTSDGSPLRPALSPVKKQSVKNKKALVSGNIASVIQNDEVHAFTSIAGGTTNTTDIISDIKKGDSGKGRQGKGGSPNENADPNNKSTGSTSNNNNITNASSPAPAVSNPMIHTTPVANDDRKHKNKNKNKDSANTTTNTQAATTDMTPITTTYTTASDDTMTNQQPSEVSFRTALEDLERLLAEPTTSPSALLGPYTPHTPSTPHTPKGTSTSAYDYDKLKTPTTRYTDSVLDYSPYSAGYDYNDNYCGKNTSMGSYNAMYAQVSSNIKPTSNPLLHTELHTSQVVDELNALLLHSPSGKASSKEACFDTIECVEDLHVARVLHRVATLLNYMNRYDESMAYLAAARSVYVMLQGDASEAVDIIDGEIAQIECMAMNM